MLGAGALFAASMVNAQSSPPAADASLLCPTGQGGSLIANSTRLTTESRLFQASYKTQDWTGGLRAIGVNPNGSLGNASDWDANANSPCNAANDPPCKIPPAAQRTILTSSPAGIGIRFTWTDAERAQGITDWLRSRIGSEELLDYLRGDQSNEAASGTFGQPAFRQRSARLGAIVNSEIAYAGPEDFGYEALVDPSDLASAGSVAGLAYPVFLQTKKDRPRLLLVGANDGMLHGFDADTGTERFAYVPRALLEETFDDGGQQRSTLTRLANQDFTPRYYVDGSPWVGDAYWGGAWRTVVVSSAGAGGKGVFALDITDPKAMAPSKVLWDIDGRSDPNMGYAFGEPVIGRLPDGNFYAFFGNGRSSDNGCPVLYVVRLADGQTRRLPTGGRSLTSSCAGTPNGLGRPSLYDVHRQGEVGFRTTDFVYAGDLQGNVWRFDLRKVSFTSDPPSGAVVQLMFSARNASNQAQPITGGIEIGAAPPDVTGSPRPAMLWFGTGSYLVPTDLASTTTQSMYGFVDRFSSGGKPDNPEVKRSDLQQQTIDVSSGTIASTNGVAYTASGSSRRDGWYLDLPQTGERIIGMPLLQHGRLIFATMRPDSTTCFGTGSSWIYAVDPYLGRALAQRAFISYAGKDLIQSTVGIVRSLVSIDAGTKTYLFAGGTSPSGAGGSTIQFEQLRALQATGSRGRVSWRELIR